MTSYKISTFGGITLNFTKVKCLKRNGNESVTIEFIERYSYLLNPKTNEYERIKHNDTTVVHFEKIDDLLEFISDFSVTWQNYLDEECEKYIKNANR